MSDGPTRTGYFFDILLPFGLWSSPALFLKFVNGLRYTMALHGTPLELPPCFGRVALPPQAPLALRVLMLCFVPVLTLDLLPIPFKQFLLQRTLSFLASNSTLSPRNFYSSRRNLLDAWSTKQHCTKRQLHFPLLASLSSFTLCAAPGERSYPACWMSYAELTIRPITFDSITSSTRTSCGGEFSSHPGMVVASSITTNRSSHQRMPVWLRCLLRRRLDLRVFRGHDVPLSRSITFKDLFAITAAVNT